MTIEFNDPAELLPVVDERDTFLYAERRDIVHQNRLFHRAVHIFVFNHQNEMLIQKRSHLKDTFPGFWEGIGGHLGIGDSYKEAALREVYEEAGIDLTNLTFVTKLNPSELTNYEFIEVFWAQTDNPGSPNLQEVSETLWITKTDFEDLFCFNGNDTLPEYLSNRKLCPSFRCSYTEGQISQVWKNLNSEL